MELTRQARFARHKRVATLLTSTIPAVKPADVMKIVMLITGSSCNAVRGVSYTRYTPANLLRLMLPKVISPQLAIALGELAGVAPLQILDMHARDRLEEIYAEVPALATA